MGGFGWFVCFWEAHVSKFFMALRHLKTTGIYTYRLKIPGKPPLLPPSHIVKNVFLIKHNKTHYEMNCEIPWAGVSKFLSKMNRWATMS